MSSQSVFRSPARSRKVRQISWQKERQIQLGNSFHSTDPGSAYLGNSASLMALIPDECAELVVTSPPFAACRTRLEIGEGAHIVPVAEPESRDEPWNGVSLCPNHPRLFDASSCVITSSLRVRVRIEWLAAVSNHPRLERPAPFVVAFPQLDPSHRRSPPCPDPPSPSATGSRLSSRRACRSSTRTSRGRSPGTRSPSTRSASRDAGCARRCP